MFRSIGNTHALLALSFTFALPALGDKSGQSRHQCFNKGGQLINCMTGQPISTTKVNGTKQITKTQSVKKKEIRRRHSKRPKRKFYASLGMGKTLPAKVTRFRAVSKFANGGALNKENDVGLDVNIEAVAVTGEYGFSSRSGMIVLVPYYLRNDVTLDSQRLQNSPEFRTQAASFEAGLTDKLIQSGVCADTQGCNALIDTGYSLNVDQDVTLPTGEKLVIPRGVPLKNFVANIPNVLTNSLAQVKGDTGLGDIELGAGYAWISKPNLQLFSGLGLGFPTGSFENVPKARRPTGQGAYILGIRNYFDYSPANFIWFSSLHQEEFALTAAKRRKSSLLDSNKLNESDPTSQAALDAGSDGNRNRQTVTYGQMRWGTIKIDIALADLGEWGQPLALRTYYHYEFGGQVFYDGIANGPGVNQTYSGLGFKVDGLGFSNPLPWYLTYEYRTPLTSNQNVAPIISQTQLAWYHKF